MPERVLHPLTPAPREPSPAPLEARRLLREASLELARLRRIRGASHKTWRRIAQARRQLAFAVALLSAPVAEPAAALKPLFYRPVPPEMTAFIGSGAEWSDPTFADIDGDGDVDVFIADYDGNTRFYENTGTATQPALAPVQQNPFGFVDVGSRAELSFADLDGDGDLDATVGTLGTNFTLQVKVFLNTGTASSPAFAAPVTNPFGLSAVITALADVDGDGDVDAFRPNFPGLPGVGLPSGMVFHENTGSAIAPAFAAGVTSPFGLAAFAQGFADLDGDGDLDAFGGSYGLVVFENTGSANAPAFAAPVTQAGDQLPDRPRLDLADLDGDGDLDARVVGYDGFDESNVSLWMENAGSATDLALTSLGNPFGLGHGVGFYGGYWGGGCALADLDGDGDLDALEAGVRFEDNVGSPTAPAFEPVTISPPNPFGVSAPEPHFVDLDADGDFDLFSGRNGSAGPNWYENTGSASTPAFGSPVTQPFGLPSTIASAAVASGDLDADGDLDLLIGQSDGNLRFFANTGSAGAPAFSPASTNPFGLADVGSYASPQLTDLDGDGDLDALVGASDGSTRFFENTGSAAAPAFTAALVNPFGLADVGSSFAMPEVADVDGDGDPDVFVCDGHARAVLFENVVIDPDACADGLDNDGDGRIDLGDDAGCANASDPSEASHLQCDNGLDDDGDGRIDWRGDGSGDPQCSSLTDGSEFPPPPAGCGIGPELVLLAPLLAALRRRREGR